ncbi:37S ribosomal protein S24, mitochondrial [Rachicladosporium monterosium]|uniref:37S ribosomal protein S24, mitochondrial n=1 Tax=Rachicladosporium monterosium TaxID=1507873 RepID=A0ABR0LEA1_9PEZI|nr:37S ribosomal protein S24, mitochondrial [Rachicladosporium monterosium]
MAAPFKRICCQATRHTTHRSPCQPYRTFSTTNPSNQADHLTTTKSPSNPFLTTLPPSGSNDSHPSSSSSPDPDYEDDDISTLGLSELHAHRELRDLLRTAAWEMPLLTSLHKPFVPPSQLKTPSPLRWRYTTYMGEAHPAASKVVLTFDPHEIPDLIKEAKDGNADGFEDVPLDTRHVRVRPKLGFPAAWKMTEERMAGLESARRVALLEEGLKVEEDRVVSGEAAIEEARRTRLLREPEQAVMVEARQTVARGKKEMKQRAGRR